jgi:hypothetical protein
MNYLYAIPVWLPVGLTATSIECQVTVAGAAGTVIRLGVYSSGASDNPGVLVLDAGTVLGDAVGVQAKAINQFLPPGLYWFAAVAQNGSPTVTTVGTGSLAPVVPAAFAGGMNCYYVAGVSAALPTSFGSVTPFTGGPKIMVKAA